MSATSTRNRIIERADALFYEAGFEATSFAEIAAAVGISRGNFYHHFKSKDQILDAVIQLRLDRTRQMLVSWEEASKTTRERILSFIGILIANRTDIMAYGCPVGTLSAELAKMAHASKDHAVELFELFRDWLALQFRALGAGDNSEEHALHVLAWSQGIASLATAFRDETFIRREVQGITTWLDRIISEIETH